MTVRPLFDHLALDDDQPYPFAESGWFRHPEPGEGSGVWAVRTRVTLPAPVRTRFRLEVIGGYELYCDGEATGRSPSDPNPIGISRGCFEADLPQGRCELFLYVWTWSGERLPPAFRFASELPEDPFATSEESWQAASLDNIHFPHLRTGRVRVVGEPTGPGGMHRGAIWKSVVGESDFPAALSAANATRMRELPREIVEDLHVLEGSGTPEEFQKCLDGDGQFSVGAGRRSVVKFRVREGEFFTRLRASGGADASIRFQVGDDTTNADVFEPRGFRQDFASFAPFEGGEVTITLEGGERGMALFRLAFGQEVPA